MHFFMDIFLKMFIFFNHQVFLMNLEHVCKVQRSLYGLKQALRAMVPPPQPLLLYVGIDNNVEEEKRRNHKSIKDIRNYVKNPNQKKSRSHTQIHYLSERLQRRREFLQSLYTSHSQQHNLLSFTSINPNDDASPFIEKTRITSCEIPKLSLTCSPNFASREVSGLGRFQAGLGCFQVGPLSGQTGLFSLSTSSSLVLLYQMLHSNLLLRRLHHSESSIALSLPST